MANLGYVVRETKESSKWNSECSKLAQKEYKYSYDWMKDVIFKLYKLLNFD